jgi:hypothetical protein
VQDSIGFCVNSQDQDQHSLYIGDCKNPSVDWLHFNFNGSIMNKLTLDTSRRLSKGFLDGIHLHLPALHTLEFTNLVLLPTLLMKLVLQCYKLRTLIVRHCPEYTVADLAKLCSANKTVANFTMAMKKLSVKDMEEFLNGCRRGNLKSVVCMSKQLKTHFKGDEMSLNKYFAAYLATRAMFPVVMSFDTDGEK